MDNKSFIDIVFEYAGFMAPKIIAVIIILFAAWLIMKIIDTTLRKFVKIREEAYVARIMGMLKLAVYGSALILIASILIPETQAFSMILLILGLAVIAVFLDVLRNIGAEFYVRSMEIVRKGDWIEVDGVFIRVVELESLGVVGETPRMEKVFIPYSKLLSTTVVNRSTPAGLLVKIRISTPIGSGIEVVRGTLLNILKSVSEDLVTEPSLTLVSMKGDRLEFVAELHLLNYRKLNAILEEVSRRIKESIPEAVIET